MKRIIFLLCVMLVFTACGSRKETSGAGDNNKEIEYVVEHKQGKIRGEVENVEREKTIEFRNEIYQGVHNRTEFDPIYSEGVDKYKGSKDGRDVFFDIDRKSGNITRVIGINDRRCKEVNTKTEEEYEKIARAIAKEYVNVDEWDMVVEIEEHEHPKREYIFNKKYGGYRSANYLKITLNENGELYGININLLEVDDTKIETWIEDFEEKKVDDMVSKKMLEECNRDVNIIDRLIVQVGEKVGVCYFFEGGSADYCIVTWE